MRMFPRSLLTLAVLASAFSFALSCLYPSQPLPPLYMMDLAVPSDSPVAPPINLQCTWGENKPLRQCSLLRQNSSTIKDSVLLRQNSSTIKDSLLRRSGLD
jgi:hypothetical protein